MNSVVHFEMPYSDPDRASDFYTKAFGWQAQKFGEDMGNYVVVQTAATDEKTGRPTEPGAINGGLFKKSDANQTPSVVIGVENIHTAMQRVVDAGGEVIGGQKPGEPDEIPGVGLYCSFVDTEGNKLSMLQPLPITQD